MSKTPTQAFRWHRRDDDVVVLTLDVPGESQNTLKEEFAAELEGLFAELQEAEGVRGIVLISGKPDTFLAGADIEMLRRQTDAPSIEALSRAGQDAMNRLAALPIPVVCAIHGPCLGGGLELALACTSRIATDDPKTVLALPEVQLGLLPGAGGTQRLPRLIGIPAALDMMLTGRRVRARKAKKMGIVDDVVPKSILLEAAVARALSLAGKARRPLPQRANAPLPQRVQTFLMEENALGRTLVFQQARKTLQKKTRGNYPAPERIIDAVELGMSEGFETGLRYEARFFGELGVSPEARQLMNIFFAMTDLKKDSGVKNKRVKPAPIQRVGVLGAGLMGAGIAYVSVDQADWDVRMKDRDGEGLARGMQTIGKIFSSKVRRGSLTAREAERQVARITTTTDMSGLASCDVVIEAVFEDLALKHQVLREVEASTGPETIFGSNTSSIPIHKIAEASSRPGNVIGLHYFSPVEKMPLLEIVVTDQTRDKVIATCVQLGKDQGKTVIVVRDGVGFYTSRILSPYMNEAAQVLAEGVAIDAIDAALMDWGFPVGPMTLLDEVGLDVAEKVGRIMIEAFGDRMTPPAVMEKLTQEGRKGRKNQKGLYTYGKGKKAPDTSVYSALGVSGQTKVDPSQLAERCALLMVNEAVRCLEEGILRSPRDGDIGAIFGLGFPPFLGGPFRYVDTLGARAVVDKLRQLEDTHGHRFAPAERLRDMAERGGSFHP